MTELHINALLTEVGVNCGDHAQDLTQAVALRPDMTIRAVCEKFLSRPIHSWDANAELKVAPDPDKYLTIRVAQWDEL